MMSFAPAVSARPRVPSRSLAGVIEDRTLHRVLRTGHVIVFAQILDSIHPRFSLASSEDRTV